MHHGAVNRVSIQAAKPELKPGSAYVPFMNIGAAVLVQEEHAAAYG